MMTVIRVTLKLQAVEKHMYIFYFLGIYYPAMKGNALLCFFPNSHLPYLLA